MSFSIHGLAVARGIAIGRAGEPGFMSSREVRQRLNMKKEADGVLNFAATVAPPPATQQVTP